MGDCWARATARFVERLVLPTPPLGESTVMTREVKSLGTGGPTVGPGLPSPEVMAAARASSRSRSPASSTGSSVAGPTSRKPERIAVSMTSWTDGATSTSSTSGRSAATSRPRASAFSSGMLSVSTIASGMVAGSSPRRKVRGSPWTTSAPIAKTWWPMYPWTRPARASSPPRIRTVLMVRRPPAARCCLPRCRWRRSAWSARRCRTPWRGRSAGRRGCGRRRSRACPARPPRRHRR